jgi:hypothetical protein
MKNTNKDWISLIQYRSGYYQGKITVEDYVSNVIKAINKSDIVAETPVIFMDNIAHVLPDSILADISTAEFQRLVKTKDFLNDIKVFFEKYNKIPLTYIKDNKINEAQYRVFQKFLGFKAVESVVGFDKKWYMLVLKRNKNS